MITESGTISAKTASAIMSVATSLNHSIITAILVAVGCVFGYGLETLLIVGGFWFGREHSQAEYRYMSLHKINRSKLKWYNCFSTEVWNKDSLFNDLIIPIVLGISLIFLI